MMNYCTIQQNSSYACYTEIGREYVVCPKPRRAGICKSPARPSGWRLSYQADIYDSNIRNELLDIILSKGDGLDSEQTYELMHSTSPFFSGSPPSRVSNPLIHDARFMEKGHNTFTICSTHLKHPTIPGFASTQSPSSRESVFPTATSGSKPAVRIEGFNAMSKDQRNCSVVALA